jgi:hypothetical protein
MKAYSAPGPVCLVREGIERTRLIFAAENIPRFRVEGDRITT